MQFGTATTDAEGEPGDRLAVGTGQPRDGALADAFTAAIISICFSRER
jgi:hypothetical protein